MRQLLVLTVLSGCLVASGCKSPLKERPSQAELDQAQEQYLRFHTDPELLAQAEKNMAQRQAEERAAQQARMAQARTTTPVPVTPAPPPTPAPVVEPAPMPPAPPPAPAVAEVKPAPAPKPVAPPKPAPKPAVVRRPAPKPAPQPTVTIPGDSTTVWLDVLMRQPTAENAMAALKDVGNSNVLAQVEALRIICGTQPTGAEHELYITAFTNVSTFVREVGVSALLRGYADSSDTWGRRLLETRGGRQEDRYQLAELVIKSGASQAFNLAIQTLSEDYTGRALYDARFTILEAGDNIVPALMRVALRQKDFEVGSTARRLYRWIQNAGSIKEAYYDSFLRTPSPVGVALFRERYGEAARPLLQKALSQASSSLHEPIQQALADLDNPSAQPQKKVRYSSRPSMAYLITYQTGSGTHRILTNTPLWPDQMPGDTQTHTESYGMVTQKSIGMKPEQLDQLRRLPASKVPSVRVDDHPVDRVDMSGR